MGLETNPDEIEQFKSFLTDSKDADAYDMAEFEIADGVTVSLGWSMEYNEPTLPVTVLIHGEGFNLFTRGRGDTLAETGSYGFGGNAGDVIEALVEGIVAREFSGDFEELIFEENGSNADLWSFTAWVPNPNHGWE